VIARGTVDAAGVMHASVVLHAKADQAIWPPDR
jgi:hypothetical protein